MVTSTNFENYISNIYTYYKLTLDDFLVFCWHLESKWNISESLKSNHIPPANYWNQHLYQYSLDQNCYWRKENVGYWFLQEISSYCLMQQGLIFLCFFYSKLVSRKNALNIPWKRLIFLIFVFLFVYYRSSMYNVHTHYVRFLQSFIISPFLCSEFQSVSRIVKIVHSGTLSSLVLLLVLE